MSSSHPAHTKIMFLDSPEEVGEKIAGASCPPRAVEGNGVLPIIRHILMPISAIRSLGRYEEVASDTTWGKEYRFASKGAPDGTLFSVAASIRATQCECGSYRHYSTYEDLERDYTAGRIGPSELKEAVINALNQVLATIRELYEGDDGWRVADQRGYPEDWPTPSQLLS